ncbi:MAG: PilZ domain-containing protein, partial [Gammaproteobacteria bacterium]
MEHRWSTRIPHSTQVTLYHKKLPVAVCTTHDIGLGGLFVTTGPLTYPLDTMLDVEIQLDNDGELKWFRLPASVVHDSENGLGMMFLESNLEVKRSIRQIILDNACKHTSKTPV